MDRDAWQATVHGVHKELDMTEYTYAHNSNYLKLTRKAPGLARSLSECRKNWPWRSYSQDDGAEMFIIPTSPLAQCSGI